MVLGNIWGACHDKTVFKDPDTFRPDRFLDEDGKFQKPDSKKFMPFSIGRLMSLSINTWVFSHNNNRAILYLFRKESLSRRATGAYGDVPISGYDPAEV